MRKSLALLSLFFLLLLTLNSNAQTVFWFEDFDNNAASRWNISANNPTPAGIPGLVYGTNNNFDYFIINDANTPELTGPIANGLAISAVGQFVQGHHYDCGAPSNLPNPFVNTGAVNRSLHITAQAGCSGLIYAGTPGYDDWNCLTITGNDFDLTQTEQYVAYNSNINATGKCNIKLTADFFLGGSANGLEAHSTILYSIDGGSTWKIVQDNLSTCIHTFAGTCNNWFRRTFELPADANGEPDLRIAFRWTEDANTNNNTQDYALGGSFNVDNVMLSACAKPNATFNSQSGTTVCKGQTVILQSAVAVNPGIYMNCFSSLTDNCTISNYAWTIAPGTFTYVDATNANSANPHIQFSANGTYSITLTVSTCGGDSIINKPNLITFANCPPVANFTSSNTLACADPASKKDTITFTDMSSTFAAPITARLWTFTPATVTYVNATTSASQNPQVTFNAPGTYQVALQVTTAEGTNTMTKVAYITVISCDCGGGAGGPITVYSEFFTAGAGAFTLNTVEAAPITSIAAPGNRWVVNSNYSGSIFTTTPNRGGGNYLHIKYNALCGATACQSIFNANSNGQRAFAESPTINTTGMTGITLSFWMLNASSGANGRGYAYYSTDAGVTWTLIAQYNSIAAWTFQTYTNAAFDNQANLRFGFRFDTGTASGGAIDPAFAVDDIVVTRPGAVTLPVTWTGTTSTNWATTTNWSSGTVPVVTDNVLIPAQANLAVGAFMPTISAAAVAKNVCNYGIITLTGNNTLTIDNDLLNEGEVKTDNVNPGNDVIFANAVSKYRGSGTMYDVDVAVTSSNLTLESDMIARSLNITTTGTVDLATFKLKINKNLTKTAGTFTAVNGEIHFINACGTCVDATSYADVTLNAAQTFGNILVNKTAGVKTSLMSNVTHTFSTPKTVTILSGILDVNTFTLSGTGNLTMSGGEIQIAKCTTVLPELSGTYSLTGGKVTLDGTCNQTIRIGVTGSTATVFSENFESPNIAANANIVGNIPGWTQTVATHAFKNKETSSLNVQTATISETFGVFGTVTETLVSPVINFGATVNNAQLRFDYQWVDLTGDTPSLQVLYKTALANPWTVAATYTSVGTFTNNLVTLPGANATYYIAFRVFFSDFYLGVAGGECSIDNIVVTGQSLPSTIAYHDVEFTGTSIKTFDNGNLYVNNQLFLTLPSTLGNYVNTANDTCYVRNTNSNAVFRSGGHVVGYLGRNVNTSDVYRYDVGSINAGGDTYYEPIEVTTASLAGTTNIVAKFYDVTVSPDTVINVSFLTLGGFRDTIKEVETEGYWHLYPNRPRTGGSYQAAVSPSDYWTLVKPWAQNYYSLLKQDAFALPWDFNTGGIRTNDSTTTAFTDFSNYALAYTDSMLSEPPIILATELLNFNGKKYHEGNLLFWDTQVESAKTFFELERASDGVNFGKIATVFVSENQDKTQLLKHHDKNPIEGINYYRLKIFDEDYSYAYSNVIALDNFGEAQIISLFPNPATKQVNFSLTGLNDNSPLVIQIVDVSGRLFFENSYELTSTNMQGNIVTEQFPAGVYFVNFSNGEMQEFKRLVILD